MNPVSHTPRAFATLPKRKQAFVHAYVRTGCARTSWLEAGYKDGGRQLLSQAGKLLREMAPYLQTAMRNYIESVEIGVMGLKVVKELAMDPEANQTVRLNAAKELLSRAVPEKARESTVTHVHKTLTNAQVDARIQEIQDQLFIDAPQATVVAIR